MELHLGYDCSSVVTDALVCMPTGIYIRNAYVPSFRELRVQLLRGGAVAPASSSPTVKQRLGKLLSQPWWVGAGVILATAVALAGYFLASGGSSSTSQNITVHGSCNAAGNGNTVTCTQSNSGATP
jgi:hypothetical protein